MSLHHGLTDLLDNNHLTCFAAMVHSSMVPGNLPSELETWSTGQTYYQSAQNECTMQLTDSSVPLDTLKNTCRKG